MTTSPDGQVQDRPDGQAAREQASYDATPTPLRTLTALRGALLRSAPRLGTGRLVCVDGPAGSGKTTLAGGLAAHVVALGRRVVLLHMDDQYEGWAGLDDAPHRVADHVLAPLAAGGTGRYRRYDWHRGGFAEEHVVAPIEDGDVVVLEGVGAGAVQVAPYRSLLVWVEAPAALRMRRGLERDGAETETEWRAWTRSEAVHFAGHGTRAAADVRVDAIGRIRSGR